MAITFLIDSSQRTVTLVQDGFERAEELVGTEETVGTVLWAEPSTASTVDVVYGDLGWFTESTFFRIWIEHRGETVERVFAGKAVLCVQGEVPPDIERQFQTGGSVKEKVEFLDAQEASRWFAANGGPFKQRPALNS